MDLELLRTIFTGASAFFLLLQLLSKNCCRAHDFNDQKIIDKLTNIENKITSLNPKEEVKEHKTDYPTIPYQWN